MISVFCFPLQEFYFDKTLLFEDGQTFIFASTVLARTVKIIPLLYTHKPGMKCLKVELIGCRMLGKNLRYINIVMHAII